jgi:mannose-1-phosphate guanylyltransferase
MLLCAGLGERLRPLSAELPKPLVPVGDRPVLAHIVHALRLAGHLSACANTHWMSEKFEAITDAFELPLTLIHEPLIRGVAGGIAGAREQLVAPVVAWNGDLLLDEPPLEALMASVQGSSGICLAVAETVGPGTVGLDATDRVVRVRGQRFGVEVRAADYVGLAGLGARALAELPDMGCLIGDYCLPRLQRGEPVDTCWIRGVWSEVGSLEGYLRANRHWLRTHSNRERGSFVAPSAQIAPGVSLRDSVIGEGAHVSGSGVLAGCVVWPGAAASAPLSDAVVTPRTTARLPSAET